MRSPGTAWQTASIALVILSVALQWYAHSGGLLTTSDSCNYISAANSFKTSQTFLCVDGSPYTYWPPLFPIVLSLFGDSWYWMQLLITGWIGVMIISYTRKIIADPLLQVLCQASILLGVHLLLIGTFLWSELLFLIILLHFTQAIERKHLVVAIILGFFLCLQRNAGLFFVIGAALWLWDVKRSVLLFLLSSSGFFAWNVYAPAVAENEYFQSIGHNFIIIADGMLHALAPVPGIFLLVVAGILIFLLKSDPKTRLPGIMLITYIVGMTALFGLNIYDDDRYAAIVLPFFMILIFRAVEIVAAKQTSRWRTVLIIAAVCWMAYPLARTLKNAQQWHKVSFTSYFCAIQN